MYSQHWGGCSPFFGTSPGSLYSWHSTGRISWIHFEEPSFSCGYGSQNHWMRQIGRDNLGSSGPEWQPKLTQPSHLQQGLLCLLGWGWAAHLSLREPPLAVSESCYHCFPGTSWTRWALLCCFPRICQSCKFPHRCGHSSRKNGSSYSKVSCIFNITACIHLMFLIPKDPKALYEL